MTRRFYWELVEIRKGGARPIDLLAHPRLHPALAALAGAADGEEQVRVACAVELDARGPGRGLVDAVARAERALAQHDLRLDLWPQLPTSSVDGERFLNTKTAARFQELLLPLLDDLDGRGVDVGVALDIEPSEELIRSAWTLRDRDAGVWRKAAALTSLAQGVWRSAKAAWQGRRDLLELAKDLRARGNPVHAAVLPPLADDGSDRLRTLLLGCPIVDDAGAPLFQHQAAMCYAPLDKRLPGTWDRAREQRVLSTWAERHRRSFDAVIVGQTATGILGDEPVYQDPQHFAEDVRRVRDLGFVDVGVYALEGLLFGASGKPDAEFTLRPDVDRWIDAAWGRGVGGDDAR